MQTLHPDAEQTLGIIDWQTTALSTNIRETQLELTVTDLVKEKIAVLLEKDPHATTETIKQTVWATLEHVITKNPVECIRFREN